MNAGEPSREALRGDLGLRRLSQAVELAERFHLFLLLCPSPRLAEAAVDILAERVSAARGRAVRVERIDPWAGVTERPAAAAALARATLEPLAAPAVPGERLVVLDLSRAAPAEDDACAALFQRLNERRNLVIECLPAPLLIVLPPRLEPIFAHAAPDFWSVRSLALRLALPVVAAASAAPTRDLATEALAPRARPATLEGARRLAAEARRVAEDAPEGLDVRRALADRLDDLAAQELEWGTLEAALAAAREGLQVRRDLLARDAERPEWLRDLTVSLIKVGDVQEARGDLDGALSAYAEGLDVRRRLLSRDAERPEWLRDLSVSLDRVGDVQRARGDLDGALSAYAEGLEVMRRLLSRDAERPEWLRDLSVSLNKVGDVQGARGDLDGALSAYAEGLEVMRRLLSRDAERPEWLRDLFVSLQRIGDVRRTRRELDQAEAALAEALTIVRQLARRFPDSPQSREDVAYVLRSLAQLEEARGRSQQAVAHWREVREQVAPLTRNAQPLPVWLALAEEAHAALKRLQAAD